MRGGKRLAVNSRQSTVDSKRLTVNSKRLTALILSSILLISFVAVTIATGFFGTNTAKISSLEKGLIGHWMLDAESGRGEATINLGKDPLFLKSMNIPNSTSSGTYGYWTFGTWNGVHRHELVDSEMFLGGKALKITGTGTSGRADFWDIGWRDNTPINTKYTLSVYVKGNGRIRLTSHFSSGPEITLTDTLTKYTFTATKGSSASHYFYVSCDNLLEGEWAHFEGFQLEAKDHATGFTENIRNSTTSDISGYFNHGTAQGGITLGGTEDRKGKNSGATTFDGVNDRIDTSIAGPIEEYTLSGWFYRSNTLGSYGTIIGSITDARPSAGFEFESLPSGGGSTLLWLYPSSVLRTTYTLNEWHFFTLTRNTTKTRLYLDNKLIGEENSVATGIIPSLQIGQWRTNSGQWFNGSMFDVRIYNRVLNEDEIRLLYDSHKPTASASDLNKGLVGHWMLDEENQGIRGTGNIFNNPTFNGESGLASGFSSYNAKYEIVDESYIRNTKSQRLYYDTSNNDGSTMNKGIRFTRTNLLPDTRYTFSFYGKGWEEITGISIYTTKGSDGKQTKEYLGDWAKYTYSRITDSNGQFDIYIRPNGNYNYNFDCLINAPQFGIYENIAKDLTPYGNDGILQGGVTIGGEPDRRGKESGATYFDGSNGYINILNNNIFEFIEEDFTVSLWAKSDYYLTGRGLVTKVQGSYWDGIGFSITSISNPHGIYFRVVGKDGEVALNFINADTFGWTHFVGLKSGNSFKAYRDGKLISSNIVAVGNISNNKDINIGRGPNNPFNGSISDVRIYNRALSDDEIKLLYDSYKPKEASTGSLNKGLVLDMPLTTKWMKSSTVVSDRTPYSNDGTVMNGAIVGQEGTTFDSSQDQYIQTKLRIQDYFNDNDEFTLSFWTKLTAMSTVRSGLVNANRYYTESTAGGFGVMLDIGNIISPHIADNQSTSTLKSTQIPINEWQHILIKYGENNFSFYQNGYFINSTSRNNWKANDQFFRVGKGIQGGWTTTSNAVIKNIRIYNRALSEEEVKLLYDKGR